MEKAWQTVDKLLQNNSSSLFEFSVMAACPCISFDPTVGSQDDGNGTSDKRR